MTGTRPSLRRRRLIAELRRLRDAAGLDLNDAADSSGISRSKLSRVETLAQHISGDDVHALCVAYGADTARTDALVTLARQAKQRGWWQVYDTDVLGRSTDLLELEADAARVHLYGVDVFPGLIQCEAYTRAIVQSGLPHETRDQHEARVRLRMERQERARANGLLVAVVVDESAFLRPVGGADVFAQQIEHVRMLADDPRHTIQVMPLSAPAVTAGMSFGYYVLSDKSTYVYLNTVPGGLYQEDPHDVDRYAQAWGRLTGQADTPTASARYWTSTTPGKEGTQPHATGQDHPRRRLRCVAES